MKKVLGILIVLPLLFTLTSIAAVDEDLLGQKKVVIDVGNDSPYVLGSYYAVYDGNGYMLFYSLRKASDAEPFLMMRKLDLHGNFVWEKKINTPRALVNRAGWDGNNYYVISDEKLGTSSLDWPNIRMHVFQIDPTGKILNSSSLRPEIHEKIMYIAGSSDKLRIFTKTEHYPRGQLDDSWNAINLHTVDFELGKTYVKELPVNEHYLADAYAFCLTPDGLVMIAPDANQISFNSTFHVAAWETVGFDTYVMDFNGDVVSRDLFNIPINNITEKSIGDETLINYMYWLPNSGIHCDIKSTDVYWDGWSTEEGELKSYRMSLSRNGSVSQISDSEWKGSYLTETLHGNTSVDIKTALVQTGQGKFGYYSNLYQKNAKNNTMQVVEVPDLRIEPSQLLSNGIGLALFRKEADSVFLYPIDIPSTSKSHIVYARAGENDMFHRTRHVMWNVANVRKVTLRMPDKSLQEHPPIGYVLIKHGDKKQKVILNATGPNGEKIRRVIRFKP